jgi:hypothetical protein
MNNFIDIKIKERNQNTHLSNESQIMNDVNQIELHKHIMITSE